MKKVTLILLTLFCSFSLFAASYKINSLDVDAVLEKNASMKVQEVITYDIEEINGILVDIDSEKNGPLTSLAVYATDENDHFQKIPQDQIEISTEDEVYHLKIYARTVNQIRKFAIVYTLAGGATIYKDVGELNRVFVGKNWQSSIDNVRVRVKLPDSIPQDSIRAFGHGPLTGNVDIQPHLIQYELQDYYPGDFVEAHILFNPDSFVNVPESQKRHENAKDKLLEAEAKMADEANAQREYYQNLQKQGNTFFGGLAAVIVSLLAFSKFILRKAPKLQVEIPEYLRELPDNNPPAIVGKLFKMNSSKLIFPTLMDLVRRKHLQLETIGEEQYLVLPTQANTSSKTNILEKFEAEIKNIYMNSLGDGNKLNLSKLSKQKISAKTSQKIIDWSSSIDEVYRSKHFGTLKSVWYFPAALLCILLIFASMIFLVRFNDIKFVVFIPFLFILVLPYILKANFPNKETQESIEKWKALKKFLDDYSLLSEAKITSIHIWEHYFVYALVLGVADKVAKAYELAIKKGDLEISEQDAFLYAPCLHTYRSFPKLENSVQSTYQRSVASIARSQRSSSSGFSGGGFSSGSSGGGGSRGGGGAF